MACGCPSKKLKNTTGPHKQRQPSWSESSSNYGSHSWISQSQTPSPDEGQKDIEMCVWPIFQDSLKVDFVQCEDAADDGDEVEE